LNIRLNSNDRAVLDAMAFLAGGTPTDVAREILGERIKAASNNRRVRELLRLRAEAQAEEQGSLREISTGTEHAFDRTPGA